MRGAAFTLAEVLITLGIIGVVAAITISPLIEKHQKQVLTSQLKATFSLIAQSIELSQSNIEDPNWVRDFDNTPIDTNMSYKIELAEKYILSNLKRTEIYGYITPNFPKKRFPTYKTMSGEQTVPTNRNGTPFYTMKLTNGSFLFFYFDQNTDGTIANPSMFVDINGAKGPNVVGKDVFIFVINHTGKLAMPGVNKSRDELLQICSKNASAASIYESCGALIEKDGWKIADDYPW